MIASSHKNLTAGQAADGHIVWTAHPSTQVDAKLPAAMKIGTLCHCCWMEHVLYPMVCHGLSAFSQSKLQFWGYTLFLDLAWQSHALQGQASLAKPKVCLKRTLFPTVERISRMFKFCLFEFYACTFVIYICKYVHITKKYIHVPLYT